MPLRFPQDSAGYRKVFVLPSVTGLTEWVDYIPVQKAAEVPASANRFEDDGFYEVNSLTSSSGLTAWVDYVPVFIVTGRTGIWRTDDSNGYIPMYPQVGGLAGMTLHYDFATTPSLEAAVGPTLDITRATTAMMKDADGWLREVQSGEARFDGANFSHNLVKWTNDYSNAAWDVSSNVTRGVDRFTDLATTNYHRIGQGITAVTPTNRPMTLSAKIKKGTVRYVYIIGLNSSTTQEAGAVFDLDTGTYVAGEVGAFTVEDASMEDAGDGYYLCSATVTFGLTGNICIGHRATAYTSGAITESYAGDTGNYTILKDVQVEDVSGAWDSENLCLQSENLSASWVNFQSVDAQAQSIAPDGSNTANKLTDDEGTGIGQSVIQQNFSVFSVSTTYTWSAFLKADQLSWARLDLQGMASQSLVAYYDLDNGAVGTVLGADNVDQGIEDYGNGWYRCWLTFTTDETDTSGACGIFICDGDGDSNVARDGTSSIFIWGAQLENTKPSQTGPGTYVATTTAAATNYSPATYIPTTTAAVTSLSGANDGLLVEEARTNVCLQSEDLSTTWVNSNSVDNQAAISAPDGSLTGNSLAENTSNTFHYVYQAVSLVASTQYTFSTYCKKGNRDWVALGIDSFTTPANDITYFDLANGVVGTESAGFDDALIEDMGNGWYRCSIVFTLASDVTGTVRVYMAQDGSTVSYAGTATVPAAYIWGAQLEAGAFPTSYIPTTTVSVTRNKEEISADVTSEVNLAESTFFVSGKTPAVNVGNRRLAGLAEDASNRVVEAYLPGTTKIGATNAVAGVGELTLTSAAVNVTGDDNFTVATALAANDAMGYSTTDSEGTVSWTADTSGAVLSSVVSLDLVVGAYYGFSLYFNGHIKEIAYWDGRLPNETLADLSTNGL